MKLDIGCGAKPKGDVNIELYPKKSEHRRGLVPPQTPNLVIADAHYLPLREKTFKIVIMIHLLEHLLHPIDALREAKRVSEKIFLTVPNNPINKECETHLYSWSKTSLQNLLSLVFDHIEIYYIEIYFHTPKTDLSRSRIWNLINHFPILSYPLRRFYLKLIKLELVAICW